MTIAALMSSFSAAQDFETVLMPGSVIAGHADLEAECSACHIMFDKRAQRQLCMDCHEDVASDMALSSGYHGLYEEARNSQCSSCHTEHEGRNAKIVVLDESGFDHDFTDFKIGGAHLEADCEDCHARDRKHRETPADCAGCHRDDNPHEDAMGEDCASCHQATEWADAEFDHDTTDYPLVGMHREAACLDCHEDATFSNTPTTCFGCHEADDAHDGRSGNQCETCHNPTDWQDSSFDHARDTDFGLAGKHATLKCGDCHSERPFEDEMSKACVSCHRDDDAHEGHNGDRCETCHDSATWQDSLFKHDRDTDYALLGGHRELDCVNCHVEPIFKVSLATSCDSCHLDDDPHESTLGTLGTQCESCHAELNWNDPVFFDHDLTRFPLLGSHKETTCDSCHDTLAFGGDDGACVSCHRDDDTHRGNLGDRCDTCHNPVAWNIWTFDHNVQTRFSLLGAHVEVACDDCHRISLEKITAISGTCRDCHRADDVHDGEFGPDCGRCHTAESFREVRSLR